MSLESATTISGLNASNPTASDPKSQGDDHLRLIKSVLKTTFPLFTGPLPYAHDNIPSKEYVDGLTFASSLPSQSGNSGKFVTTDGTTASWANIPNPQPASTTLSGLVYLATIQEAIDGVQTTHAVTPAGLGSALSTVSTYLGTKIAEAEMMLDSAITSPSGLVAGMKRWNSTGNKFEKWSGSAWGDLASTYSINISGNAATATSAASCTGNAATASNASLLGGHNSAYFQPALGYTALNKAGDTITGDLRISYSGDPTTGMLYFGNTGSVYLNYSGSSFTLSAPLIINGDTALRNGDVATANSAPVKTALNAEGSAPIYAVRAFCSFNGAGTPAVRGVGSQNISSIGDGGVGIYALNFASAMPDADYVWSGSGRDSNFDGDVIIGAGSTSVKTASSLQFMVMGGSAILFDATEINIVVIR